MKPLVSQLAQSGAVDDDVMTWDATIPQSDGTSGEWVPRAPTGGVDTDDQTAAEVPFTPTGTLAATNVQAALAELDAEKSGTGHSHASAGIPPTLLDAKGDLIVGSADDTAARLPVGATTGHVLTVDPLEVLGLKWAAPAAGGSAHTVQDEGVSLTQRSTLNFVGAGATVTDDPVNAKTLVTIPGSTGGSGGITVVTKTAAYTAAVGELVRGDTTAGAFTVTLPTGPAAGSTVTVKKVAGTADLTVAGGSIEHVTSLVMLKVADSVTFVYSGTAWMVTAQIGTAFRQVPALSTLVSATYGDTFEATSLDAKWTRVGYLAADETYRSRDGSMMTVVARAAGNYYYQAAPAGDFEVIYAGHAAISGTSMFGVMVMDATGKGVGGGYYNSSPNGPLMGNLVAGAYTSGFLNAATTGSVSGTVAFDNVTKFWIRLKKTGTGYQLATSTTGETWNPLSGTFTPAAFAPARIAFGVWQGSAITSFSIDVFDVR